VRELNHETGTLNTNGYTVDVLSYRATGNVTLNLSDSDIFVNNFFSAFENVVINPGTSHIYFDGPVTTLTPYAGQSFYDVSFENDDASHFIEGYYNQDLGNPVTYHQVEFFGDGTIE